MPRLVVPACYVAVLAMCIPATSVHGDLIDFERDIAPIFEQHCFDCHGPEEQESQLRLDRLANMLAGGNSGEPAIVPSDPKASFLLRLVRHEEPDREMPPDGKLSQEHILKIERWIAQGAKTPASYGPAKAKAELSHWAFQPIRREKQASIDQFIRQKLDDHHLQMSEPAERQVLIRRLYLIMLGIPPTPQQVAEFVNDNRRTAWRETVDQVLASPHYGERWATHWLDLVRFGETHGFEMNRERPHAWHYRDWVIASLNDDKPYDQFVREQLAGDALGADVGTAFLVAGPNDQVKSPDPKLGQQQRMNELDDMINTTGTAFLGLTTGCACCHNHKFDPISQRDYYALQAVFAGVEHGDRALTAAAETEQQISRLNAEISQLTMKLEKFRRPSAKRPAVNAVRNEENFPPRKVQLVRFSIEQTSGGEGCIDELEIFAGQDNLALTSLGAKTTSSGDFEHPLHRLEHINDGRYGNARSWIAASEQDAWVQIELAQPAMIDRIVWGRDREERFSDRLATKYRIETAIQNGAWELLVSSADRQTSGDNETLESKYQFDGLSVAEVDKGQAWLARLQSMQLTKERLEQPKLIYAGQFTQPGPTYRLYRGEPDAPREQVGPNAIEALGALDLAANTPEQQRRLALADWIVDEQNPLTSRVIANRIWQFHFGNAIVDTPSDFGINGARPTHPELLDYLASELIDHGWSLKHIHRLILNSETWRQDHQPRTEALQVDAGSRWLWRFPPRRLQAESIRDSILYVSGVLDLQNAGGPGYSPFQVEMENVRHYHAKTSYGPEDWRRMIYMTKIRQEREQVFGNFDCPDGSMVVAKRSRSTTPLQALGLFNSEFVMQQAELFATRLQRESNDDKDRIVRAWQLCFQRNPTQAELADSQQFIQQQGLKQFTRALLNSNEFLFIP